MSKPVRYRGSRVVASAALAAALAGCADSNNRAQDVSPPDSAGYAVEVCGLTECGGESFCCLATGRCEASRAACAAAVPPSTPEDPGTPCGTNLDCPPNEYCAGGTIDDRCLSAGYCRPRAITCTGTEMSPVCGCDGRTYDSGCAAAAAGVRRISTSACGEPTFFGDYTCGPSGECPDGLRCCGVSRLCVRADCETCCGRLPSGRFGCEVDSDCRQEPDAQFCYGLGCDGQGECFGGAEFPSPDYPELIADCGMPNPACDCEGREYLNRCEIVGLRRRVDLTNACLRK